MKTLRIFIVGGGEIGSYLAKHLVKISPHVTMMDMNQEKIEIIESQLGIATFLGSGSSYKSLVAAGAGSADIFISVTSDESVNITAAMYAKKAGAKFTIARISNMEYLINKDQCNLSDFGIDELISPESLAAREVKYILQEPSFTEIFDVEEGRLTMMAFRLNESASVIGKRIAEIQEISGDRHFIIAAILRNGKIIIPKGSTMLERNDYLYIMSTPDYKEHVLKFAEVEPVQPVTDMIIMGGSRTGAYLAHRMSKHCHVKIIEKDIVRCRELAIQLPGVDVVQGDCTNTQLLNDVELFRYDALIAVTGNSEANIFSCLLARDLGVPKTIALVENIGLFEHSQKIGVDTLINKKIATANFIFRKLKPGDIVSYLYGIDAEMLSFEVNQNSSVKDRYIRDLKLPENAIISGAVRNGKGLITLGDFQIREGDKILVLTMESCTEKVETLFKL
jgi:trk system potassium uptake protein